MSESPIVELVFKIAGDLIPIDHGYPLYSGISHIIPELHDLQNCQISKINGIQSVSGMLNLTSSSCMVMRLESTHIPLALKLAGKKVDINGQIIQFGIPQTCLIQPASILFSRIVLIKGFTEPDTFKDALERQLIHKQITNLEIEIQNRKIMKMKEKKLVGFSVFLRKIKPEDSVIIQSEGLGGKHKMGCGVFLKGRE